MQNPSVPSEFDCLSHPWTSRSATATGARLLVPALLWSVGRRPGAGAHRGRDRPVLRRVRTALKWGRALRGNLLWFLLGLPAVITVAVSALAAISWLFFHRPLMRTTRLESGGRRAGDGVVAVPGVPGATLNSHGHVS